ncbi:hypothetical protein F8M41_009825 [Gigaspora margarita]|uniref:Uncharacterized protein n=1 Tax=Gigaspora margarita TaxID=4874 RepID=A0A8H3X3H4_GIGMA|nr:hypothetical protein F8M41_009825 [Gigaspora margarita]
MDANNLIEALYIYEGRPKRCLDSEVYLLVKIVLQNLEFSAFLDDLNIGKMNLQQQQQQIWKIDSSYSLVNYANIEKREIEKLQEELTAITTEWKDKDSQDIHSL